MSVYLDPSMTILLKKHDEIYSAEKSYFTSRDEERDLDSHFCYIDVFKDINFYCLNTGTQDGQHFLLTRCSNNFLHFIKKKFVYQSLKIKNFPYYQTIFSPKQYKSWLQNQDKKTISRSVTNTLLQQEDLLFLSEVKFVNINDHDDILSTNFYFINNE